MDADDLDLDLDLDKLLDEVEEKFCRHVSVASSARGHADTREEVGQKRHTRSVQKNSISEDIDALLEDLLDDQQHRDTAQPKREQIPGEKKPLSQSGWRRCCPVFIGGSSLTNGVGTATTKRSCDQLRCVSCDFGVLMFDDCEWEASCDYLFFRLTSVTQSDHTRQQRTNSSCVPTR
ncbi:cilia- and flagella-associated protein 418 isoform X3 [Solea solea]|uniref:cilia- and flagella-associated protein 418 isoform X3 n=1 Tax=Solea solea TaxID=90069 RepID=UPI00272B1DB3|nr:cilia- and flagella-associated protein 418 isoform X3 [Solea solea]